MEFIFLIPILILILTLFSIFITSNVFNQRHFKKLHLSLPFKIKSFKPPLTQTVKFKFTQDNKYLFNDENQYDFNKLFGYKGKYFKPRFNTVMVGWRYNPEMDKFQVLPYFHIGSKNYDFNMDQIINLNVNQECIATTTIIRKSVKMTLKTENQEITESRIFTEEYSRFWSVLPWFGGTYPSPKNMKLFIQK